MSIWGKICWGLTAILLIATGIVCFCSPAGTLAGLSTFLGISLIISGIGSIGTFVTTRRAILGAGWVLLGGIVTIILGILVLSNTALVSDALPILFGFWIVFMGLARIISAFDVKKLKLSGWWLDIIWGALLIALGALSFYLPAVNAILITVFTGLFFVFNGIAMLVELYYACKIEKKATEFLDKINNIVIEPDRVTRSDLPEDK